MAVLRSGLPGEMRRNISYTNSEVSSTVFITLLICQTKLFLGTGAPIPAGNLIRVSGSFSTKFRAVISYTRRGAVSSRGYEISYKDRG